MQIQRTKYARYENAESEPNIETLIKLADFYKVTVDELIGHNVPYHISKVDFSNSQLTLVEEIKNLNEAQITKVMAYVQGLKDGKNN